MNTMENPWSKIKIGVCHTTALGDCIGILCCNGISGIEYNYPTAYVGFPKGTYKELVDLSEYDRVIDVHGGVTYTGCGIAGGHKDYYLIGWDYNHYNDYGMFNKTGNITTVDTVKYYLEEALQSLCFVYDSRLQDTPCRRHLFQAVRDRDDELNHIIDCACVNNKGLTDSYLTNCPYLLEKTVIEQDKFDGVKQ